MRAHAGTHCSSGDGNVDQRWTGWPNVWLGATIGNQQEADRDIPKLLATPAAKRFVSIEPMLGPVDLMATDYLTAKLGRYPFNLPDEHRTKLLPGSTGSSPAAIQLMRTPIAPDWFRSLRDQCTPPLASRFHEADWWRSRQARQPERPARGLANQEFPKCLRRSPRPPQSRALSRHKTT